MSGGNDGDATEPESRASVDDNSYWRELVHTELKSKLPPNFFLRMTYDSWWKINLAHVLMLIPCPTASDVRVEKVPGIGYYYYSSSGSESSALHSSAVLWIHGGGRVMGGAGNPAHCSRIVQLLGVPVLSASYRLAPRHPFPAALDDLVRAYQWLVMRMELESTSKGATSKVSIAVAGDSAGGGLAAELCQRLLDESQGGDKTHYFPLPVAQLLIEPMLDDRTCVDKDLLQLPPHLVWNNISNMYCWSSYLGPEHKPGDKTLPTYASAARRVDLSNLPPAFIACGDLDLFRGECQDYARRLKNHGVETEYVEIKGGFHAMFEVFKDEEPILQVWRSFQAFGKKFLLV